MLGALLLIDFWDVGQGDCTVIRLPSGKSIIIDVGPVGSPLVDWLNERRPPVTIDSIILTHNDSDHAGALASIVREHGGRIGGIRMLQDRDRNTAPFQKIFRTALEGANRNLYPLSRLELGTLIWADEATDTRLTVLHPSFADNITASSPNDTSAVIQLSVAGKPLIVWPGDLEIRKTANVMCGDCQRFYMVLTMARRLTTPRKV